MKRHLATLLLVLLCLTPITTRYWIQETYGAEICRDNDFCYEDIGYLAHMNPAMLGSGGGVASACNAASNEVGDRTDYGSEHLTISAGSMPCFLYTADCSENLAYAHVRHYGADIDNVKVCVYSDDGDSGPDSGDSLIACSVEITGNATSDYASSSKVGSSVTSTSPYWVCMVPDSTSWEVVRTASGTRTFYTHTGITYASPPSTLADGSWTSTASRDASLYEEIE